MIHSLMLFVKSLPKTIKWKGLYALKFNCTLRGWLTLELTVECAIVWDCRFADKIPRPMHVPVKEEGKLLPTRKWLPNNNNHQWQKHNSRILLKRLRKQLKKEPLKRNWQGKPTLMLRLITSLSHLLILKDKLFPGQVRGKWGSAELKRILLLQPS